MQFTRAVAFALGLAVLTAASCGGGDSNGTPSSPTPTPNPTPAPSSPTIGCSLTPPAVGLVCITSSGVSPRSVTVAAGSRVTFVNNDSRVHDMASNPHPAHTDCPAINQAGFLQPAQSRETGNLNTVRTCGYHDHSRESDTSLQGTIVIQ